VAKPIAGIYDLFRTENYGTAAIESAQPQVSRSDSFVAASNEQPHRRLLLSTRASISFVLKSQSTRFD